MSILALTDAAATSSQTAPLSLQITHCFLIQIWLGIRGLCRPQVKKMTSYLRAGKFKRYDEVPDPYFAAPGQQQGFDLVRASVRL